MQWKESGQFALPRTSCYINKHIKLGYQHHQTYNVNKQLFPLFEAFTAIVYNKPSWVTGCFNMVLVSNVSETLSETPYNNFTWTWKIDQEELTVIILLSNTNFSLFYKMKLHNEAGWNDLKYNVMKL